jgi:amidase
MRSGQIGDLDATAQAALVARGELSAAEVIEAAIERIERLNPVLNCVIFPRYERACAEARALATDAASPFAGVPFLMKDLIQTVAGEPFSWGWKPLKDARMRARATSYVAAKFGAAGLISLGQTTVPEWGVSLSTETAAWGVTHNPWKLGHAAGGSSGGAASAVAARLVPIAHANDGGGSIRIPAAFCGLVGLKPSRGRTSLGPAYAEIWHGLCEEGVLAHSVRDVAAALDAISGYMPGDPWTAPPPVRRFADEVGLPPGSLRIGVMNRTPKFHSLLDPDQALAVRDVARALEQLGHRLTEDFPGALDDERINRVFGRVVAAGEARQAVAASELLGRALEAGDFDPWTWFLIERGRRIAAADYLAACDYFNEFSRAIARWFSEGSFNVLVTPTTPAAAPPLGYFKVGANESAVGARLNRMTAFTMPWNITGLPAVSLPLYATANGLPIGVQFVAGYGREDVLLRLAAQLEVVTAWSSRHPPNCA